MKKRYRLSVTVRGKRVYSLLYRRWKDLRNRTQGRGTQRPDVYSGMEIGWATFAEFRAWALANGFSKADNSPDRQVTSLGYTADNVVFVTPEYNRDRALRALHGNECSCDTCIPF